MDNQQELFPIVDEEGRVTGCINRGQAHDGTKILHPVVHLHLFNSKGELFLQKRPDWKDIQPGKWDTAVGGHVAYGEEVPAALRREVEEELGINDFDGEFIQRYIFEGPHERELVYVFKTVYDKPLSPSTEELSGGRFFTRQEILSRIGTHYFTPNFEDEYIKIFG